VIKQKVNKFFKIILESKAVYERAVLFGFYLKKMEAEAVLFLVALPQKSAASASLVNRKCVGQVLLCQELLFLYRCCFISPD